MDYTTETKETNTNNSNNDKSDKPREISSAVVKRLPRYYRYLSELLRDNTTKISSKDLAEMMDITASQIRSDLNCFGEFGHQGYGYNVHKLHGELAKILGVDRNFTAVIVGAGSLGAALTRSNLFVKRGVSLRALFDINPALIGTRIAELEVLDAANMAAFCHENEIDIAVLTLPKEETQNTAAILAEVGVKGFWNFSNMELELRLEISGAGVPGLIVENMHMGDSLMTLCYALSQSL